MKIIIIIHLLVILPVLIVAQGIKQNNVYLEIAGASMYYSVNYERLWLDNENYNISTRAGLMYIPFFDDQSRTIVGIPIGASYLKKLSKDYLELGISFSVIRDTYNIHINNSDTFIDELILMPSIRAGLRHQPTDTKLFWNILAQASMMAHSETERDEPYIEFLPLFSLGIGYSF